jgi:peroxiredoxin
VELEESRVSLEKNGVRIAAVSYDSQEVLSAFVHKHAIGYPLLSDHGSEVIRSFGIFNSNMAPELRSYGVPHPVEYLISTDGVLVKKYFVPNYQHRVAASSVALEQFGE